VRRLRAGRSPSPLAKLETPQLREVTSQSPGALLKGQKTFSELFLTCLLAAMTAALFGLPFHLGAFVDWHVSSGSESIFSAPAQVGTWWPAPLHSLVPNRAFVFLQGPTGNEPCANSSANDSSCQDGARRRRCKRITTQRSWARKNKLDSATFCTGRDLRRRDLRDSCWLVRSQGRL